MNPKIALVGVRGVLGRDMLDLLAERDTSVSSIVLLETGKAVGREYSYGDEDVLLRAKDVQTVSWQDIDVVFFLDDARKVPALATSATQAGCLVIDLTGALALESGVPLVAMDVNSEDLRDISHKRQVACPGGASLLAAMVLGPLSDRFGIRRGSILSIHSTTTGGREAQDELFRQTKGIFVNQPVSETQAVFPKQIAFNVIPQVGSFVEGGPEDGATSEEVALMTETGRILDPTIRIRASCVQGPLFVGTALDIAVECDEPVTVAQVRTILREAGISVVDHRQDGAYATPIETVGEDVVFVSRIRLDRSVDYGVSLWCVGDALRLQALNAIRIAERVGFAK